MAVYYCLVWSGLRLIADAINESIKRDRTHTLSPVTKQGMQRMGTCLFLLIIRMM